MSIEVFFEDPKPIEKVKRGRPKKNSEPKCDRKLREATLEKIVEWYKENTTPEDVDNYVFTYLKDNYNKDYTYDFSRPYTPHFGYLCRVLTQGGTLPYDAQIWFDKTLFDVLSRLKEKKSKPLKLKPKVSKQEAIINNSMDVVEDVELALDDYIAGRMLKIPSFKSIMQNIKGVHAKQAKVALQSKIDEFNDVLTTTDKYVIEAYSIFTRNELKKIISFYQAAIDECDSIIGFSQRSRKPRKKKEKSIDSIVSKVQFLQSHPELKLTSLNPREIIGATHVWVYNVKYKKLGCYCSINQDGFSIKGTTITGFDERRSIQKIIRKPETLLTKVLEGSKLELSKLLDGVKTTTCFLTGRLNGDTIIMRTLR